MHVTDKAWHYHLSLCVHARRLLLPKIAFGYSSARNARTEPEQWSHAKEHIVSQMCYTIVLVPLTTVVIDCWNPAIIINQKIGPTFKIASYAELFQ